MTYEQLQRHSLTLSNYLSKHTQADVMAIMLPNLLSFPVSLFGAWYSDKTVVLINPLFTSDELLKECLDAKIETIIIAKIFYKTLSAVIDQTQIKTVISVEIGDFQPKLKAYLINLLTHIKYKIKLSDRDHIKHIDLAEILSKGVATTAENSKTFYNKIALLQYTGGTSGVLKAAILKHENILANINQLEVWLPKSINANSSILTALPLYHIFALTVNCLLFIHIKGSNILVLNPQKIKQLITPLKKYSVNVITGVNTLFSVLVRHQYFKQLNWSPLKVAISGGMSLDKTVSDAWQTTTGKPIIQGYGLTECSPVVSAESYTIAKFSGSVGKPLLNTQIEIFDTSFKPVKTGEIGEIGIKGPQVMDGYWHQKEPNQQVFTNNGYFLSGDIGYVDNQGRVFIVDRAKDMIIVSGFNVYPCDIECVLNQHPAVIESACIGIKNKTSGQSIKAFVVKKPGSTLQKKALISYCKEHLTHYKIPQTIEWIDTLPKSNIGKILKRALN